MALPAEELYSFHNMNLHAVDSGVTHIGRQLRRAIAAGEDETVFVLLRIYMLLIGAWAECRLSKLLYESNGFTEDERAKILLNSSKIDQWFMAVEIGFRKQYKLPKSVLCPPALPETAFYRLTSIRNMIDTDLRSIIEVRNKLAHGQWKRTLTNDGMGIANDQMKILGTENALSAQFRISMLGYLCDIIHDLVSSRNAFERDFDKHFQLISNTKMNLKNRTYDSYKDTLVKKYKRGAEKRDNAIRSGY